MPHTSWPCWLVGSLINTCLGRQPPGAAPAHDPTQFGRRVGYACHRTDVSVVPPGRTRARRRISAMRSSLNWDAGHASSTLSNIDWDLRAKAILAVAYSTMARRSELVALTLED